MLRAAFELLLTVIVVVIARAILTSVMRGVANAGRAASTTPAPNDSSARQDSNAAGQQSQPTGDLHKDPVCGTYVADSTPFRRQASGQTFYYCSSDCKEKHALAIK